MTLAAAAPAHAGLLGPQDALFTAGAYDDVSAVAVVGDVNGDGIGDLAVQHGDRARPGTRVVFGGPAGGGFTIEGVPDQVPDGPGGLSLGVLVESSLAAAGDVDGDGLADVLIGTATVGNSLRRRSGSVFVVFGKRDDAPVRLDDLGDRGFRIDGPRGGSLIGSSVAGLGDVDGDGLADVALDGATEAYVVFGRASGALVDLRAPGDRAFAVADSRAEPDEYMQDPHHVAAAGDANGDGRGDLAVVRDDRISVVFGRPGTDRVDVARLGAGGYAIDAGGFVRSAGDVDGDGRGDVAISSTDEEFGGEDTGAPPRVVFGRAEPADAARVLLIEGARGTTPVGIGDVNGDGRGDLAFADPGRNGSCRTSAGGLVVVFGRGPGTTDVRRGGGFLLHGDESRAELGRHLAGGDVTGDGQPEIVASSNVRGGPRFALTDDLRRSEIRVVPASDTRVPVPRRGRCLVLRRVTGSFRRAAATRRLRLRLTAKEAGSYLVIVETLECVRRRCSFGGEIPPGRVERFATPGTRTITLRIGRGFLRDMRRPNVEALIACVEPDERGASCVELAKRRR